MAARKLEVSRETQVREQGLGRGRKVTSSYHVTTLYLFIECLIDVAEVMRSKLQKTLQLLSGHLLHNKPVICHGNRKKDLHVNYSVYFSIKLRAKQTRITLDTQL